MGMTYNVAATQPDGVRLEFNTSGQMTIKSAGIKKTTGTNNSIVSNNNPGSWVDVVTISTPNTVRAAQQVQIDCFLARTLSGGTGHIRLYNDTGASSIVDEAISMGATETCLALTGSVLIANKGDHNDIKLQIKPDAGDMETAHASIVMCSLVD